MLFDTEPENANRAIREIRKTFREAVGKNTGPQTSLSCEIFAYAGKSEMQINRRVWLNGGSFELDMDDPDQQNKAASSGGITNLVAVAASTEHLVGQRGDSRARHRLVPLVLQQVHDQQKLIRVDRVAEAVVVLNEV